jgi:hypothetical protein
LIRLVKILIILDNLGWYCDVTNIFVHQRQIQIVARNIRNIYIFMIGYGIEDITWFGAD